MRPLAVLILVLAALAALFFALFGDSERRPQPNLNPGTEIAQAPQNDGEVLTQLEQDPRKEPIGLHDPAREPTELPTDPDSSFQGFITGQVIDTDNYSVADATIKLISIPEGGMVLEQSIEILGEAKLKDPTAVVQSLSNGDYALDGVQAGDRWCLVVSHPNYSPTVLGPLTVPENGGLPHQLIVLVPGNTLYGRVSDKQTGVSIPGAVISLTTPMAAFRRRATSELEESDTVADEQGNYRILNTDRSSKTLTIRAPGYATAIFNNFVAVPAKKVKKKPFMFRGQKLKPAEPVHKVDTAVITREYNIELEAGMSIAGTVLAPDGSGVIGAKIQAYCLTTDVGSFGHTLSLEGGEFIVADLGPGQYSVQVEAKGYTSGPTQRVEVGTADLVIQLVEQGGVAGRAINDETGSALRKFNCTVRTAFEKNLASGTFIKTKNFSDKGKGAFTIHGLEAGEYVIEVKARGLASSFSAPFKVAPGEVTGDVLIRVTKGGSLRGKVIDKRTGKPLAGAQVNTRENNHMNSPLLLALSASGRSASTKARLITAEDGTFELKLMTPHTYQVTVEKAGYSTITLNDVSVGDGVETPLEAIAMTAGALIEGNVWNDDGSPVPGANVMLNSKDRNNHWGNRTARTDSNGHYTINNVHAGEFELSATRPKKPGDSFLAPALDMKKSTQEIYLEEGGHSVFDLNFSEKP
jgi:protocatechuate 3,4-dioxygenase beta subunit